MARRRSRGCGEPSRGSGACPIAAAPVVADTDGMSSPPVAIAERRAIVSHRRYSARFLETVAQSGGVHTLLEIELDPGSGHPPHRHVSFGERFRVVEGTLTLTLRGEEHRLGPGETATAPIGALHGFANDTDAPVRLHIEALPGHRGFEQALQIIDGLERDGLIGASGYPRRLSHTAVIVSLSESRACGGLRLYEPLFALLARRARRRGIEQELVERYCRF